jgi:hypothetical protein
MDSIHDFTAYLAIFFAWTCCFVAWKVFEKDFSPKVCNRVLEVREWVDCDSDWNWRLVFHLFPIGASDLVNVYDVFVAYFVGKFIHWDQLIIM